MTKRRRRVVIKGSSLPVLRIVVRDGDASALRKEVADTIENARPMLAEAIAVVDLRERKAREVGAREIVDAVRDTGVRVAAVLIGDASERDPLAGVDFPVIEAQSPQQPAEEATELDLAPAYLTRPLRSGQRFYAQGRDVVVAAPTSRGSELIADGSIYAFSSLRGRVLAGASGNASACIVASHLDAELVAVAGVYRTFEADDLKVLGSGPVSVGLSLEDDGSERLTLASLAPSPYMQRR